MIENVNLSTTFCMSRYHTVCSECRHGEFNLVRPDQPRIDLKSRGAFLDEDISSQLQVKQDNSTKPSRVISMTVLSEEEHFSRKNQERKSEKGVDSYVEAMKKNKTEQTAKVVEESRLKAMVRSLKQTQISNIIWSLLRASHPVV